MDKVKEAVERLSQLEGPAVGAFMKVVTLTPILLTVLATVLAGLSSSEMTRSMYYRSLAAQHQAKVADQWAFFQAKRMRGALAEAERERRPVTARPGPDPALLTGRADRLARELERAGREARQMRDRLPSGNGQAGDTGRQAGQDLVARADAVATEATRLRAGLDTALAMAERAAFVRHFGTGDFPDHSPAPPADRRIEEASRAIQEHRPEEEVNQLLAAIPDSVLHQAVITAEDDAHAFEHLRDRTSAEIDGLGKSIKGLLAQAGALHQAVRSFETRVLFADATAPAAGSGDPRRAQVHSLAEADAAVREAAEELKDYWSAAVDEYTAWRYSREARDNRRLAEVLEVQVHKSSYQSDRHHQRSQNFFFGMLAAQAGVVISSMAVAARRKSSLWVLASVAGILALGFSAWVYLSV
jgi:hypothetical protein